MDNAFSRRIRSNVVGSHKRLNRVRGSSIRFVCHNQGNSRYVVVANRLVVVVVVVEALNREMEAYRYLGTERTPKKRAFVLTFFNDS